MNSNERAWKRALRSARSLRLFLFVLALPLLMAGECEEPLVKDSGFDLWCGDMLCAWEVDEGAIAKVPTWNASDHGVALVAAETRISQLLSYSSDDVSCLHFSLLANVDAAATVTLELDFGDHGGTPDVTQTLSTGAWSPIDYHLVTPTYFQSVRVSLRKSGAGQAVLAQIQVAKSSGCTGAPPQGSLGRPAGATCESASQCAGSSCLARQLATELIPDPSTPRDVCASCASDADCAAGSVCGLTWSPAFLEPFPGCAAPPALSLGERCLTGAACATGVCCAGVCSACCASVGPTCASSDLCAERPRDGNGSPLRAAFQCGPGASHGAGQTACLGDTDCASGHCTGAASLSVCAADGRRCATPADCPHPDQNSCIALGVAGGRCD
ncbi:MAG TPA: hypothetical protein VGP07_13215 [Polyangia bacterium]